MEKVSISLRVRSRYPGQEADTVSFTVPGTLHRLENSFCLVYQEPEMENITTHLRFSAGEAVMERSGTRMEFRPGEMTLCPYRLDFGTMDMLISTRALRLQTKDGGGRLDMMYSLGGPGQEPGQIDFHLQYSFLR